MLKVFIPINQCWSTVDDLVKYLDKLKTDLVFLKKLPEGEPTDLYFHITGDNTENGVEIVLTNS